MKIFKLISFLLHPQFILPLILFSLFYKERQWGDFLVVFILSFLIPFAYFLHLFFTKQISDWDIVKRSQRHKIYFFTLLGFLFSSLFLYQFSTPFLFQEFLKFLILGSIIMALNFKIKVSLHAALVTVLCIILVRHFNTSPAIFLTVPLVAVSRFYLKRHTFNELILGAALPLFFYALF